MYMFLKDLGSIGNQCDWSVICRQIKFISLNLYIGMISAHFNVFGQAPLGIYSLKIFQVIYSYVY